ncbi:Glycoside hydrolase family 10 domain [Dillenia turbinata]|uniref:Glycoside hydrolase family 10 domain n=1 Tax=Dillenia turbinata TaxID=194707 RepID=A0AAN8W4F4_9MAGN
MRVYTESNTVLLLCFLALGLAVDAVPYDYTASIEASTSRIFSYLLCFFVQCLKNPHKPQYGGGIIKNPELNEGLKGWSSLGGAKIEQTASQDGNNFIVAYDRNQSWGSFSQIAQMEKDNLYTFSAWLQVNEENVSIAAVFKTPTGFKNAGSVIAECSCWSMLKGGLTANFSGPAELYFESDNTSVEIWADSSHCNHSLKKNGALTMTTFENEMKWISNEPNHGQEDYSIPDSMLNFAGQNGIAVRGHNIFWDDPSFQPGWLKSLSIKDLRAATGKRISSIMTRYRGKVIGWDVVNENMHNSFFEQRWGPHFTPDS